MGNCCEADSQHIWEAAQRGQVHEVRAFLAAMGVVSNRDEAAAARRRQEEEERRLREQQRNPNALDEGDDGAADAGPGAGAQVAACCVETGHVLMRGLELAAIPFKKTAADRTQVGKVQIMLNINDLSRTHFEFGKSILHLAAEYGRFDVVSLVIDCRGIHINLPCACSDMRAWTPLQYAVCGASEGHVNSARCLLAQPGISLRSKNGTVLHTAVCYGPIEVVRMIVEKDPSLVSDASYTDKIVKYHLRGGGGGAGDDQQEQQQKIIKNGASGVTPLHLACGLGRRDIAAYLIDRGAFKEALDTQHTTPLDRAVANGHESCVRLLFEKRTRLLYEEFLAKERRKRESDTTLTRELIFEHAESFSGGGVNISRRGRGINLRRGVASASADREGSVDALISALRSGGGVDDVAVAGGGAAASATLNNNNNAAVSSARPRSIVIDENSRNAPDNENNNNQQQQRQQQQSPDSSPTIPRFADANASTAPPVSTLLLACTGAEKLDIVKFLVFNGLSVNDFDCDNENMDNVNASTIPALHQAVKSGHVNTVEFLLGRGGRADQLDPDGRPPIYYAINSKLPSGVAMTRILLQHESMISKSMVCASTCDQLLVETCDRLDWPRASLLLRHGASPLACREGDSDRQLNALQTVCAAFNLDRARAVLSTRDLDRYQHDCCFLIKAIVKTYCEKHKNWNQQQQQQQQQEEGNGNSSTNNQQKRQAQYLLRKPYDIVNGRTRDNVMDAPIHLLARNNNFQGILTLIEASKATPFEININQQNRGGFTAETVARGVACDAYNLLVEMRKNPNFNRKSLVANYGSVPPKRYQMAAPNLASAAAFSAAGGGGGAASQAANVNKSASVAAALAGGGGAAASPQRMRPSAEPAGGYNADSATDEEDEQNQNRNASSSAAAGNQQQQQQQQRESEQERLTAAAVLLQKNERARQARLEADDLREQRNQEMRRKQRQAAMNRDEDQARFNWEHQGEPPSNAPGSLAEQQQQNPQQQQQISQQQQNPQQPQAPARSSAQHPQQRPRCANPRCPCDAHNGVDGTFCCQDCEDGFPCMQLDHPHRTAVVLLPGRGSRGRSSATALSNAAAGGGAASRK